MTQFAKLDQEMKKAEEWFKAEIASLRTGRATPALVEGIEADVYGAKTPLEHMAAINVEDARTLSIKPWDKSNIPAIEAAIRSSKIGIQPITSEDTIRVILPELTEERRTSLKKLLGEKLEEAKIAIRHARDEVWSATQKQERDGEISEDDKFRLKEEMQEAVDEENKKLEEIAKKKEEEISK